VSSGAIALLVLGLGLVAWLSARAKAQAFAGPGKARPHSLPGYHGWYVALWAVIPALLFLAVWSSVSGGLVTGSVLDSPAAASLPTEPMQRTAILDEARALARGTQEAAFNPQATALAPEYERAQARMSIIGTVAALLLAFAGGAFAFTRVSPVSGPHRVERLVMAVLLTASLIAILTTLGIVLSLLFESMRFFARVNPIEFLFGTTGARRPRFGRTRRAPRARSARSRSSGAPSSSVPSSRCSSRFRLG
jgi:phosphate transport system permease protein